jgi:cytochrome c oxidase subunit 2
MRPIPEQTDCRSEGAVDVILERKARSGRTKTLSRLRVALEPGFVAAIALVIVLSVGVLASGTANAAEMIATPQIEPWQVWLQPANTLVMEHIRSFADLTMWIVGFITLFVLALLVYVMVRFNAKANPVPSKVSHNTMIEVAWTIIPVLILVVIAVPSLRLLYEELVVPPADMTIKAIGKASWSWSYEYADVLDGSKNPVTVDSLSLTTADSDSRTNKETQPRLLSVDNNLVVPVGKTIKMLVTAEPISVIHSFAVPSFGIKVDAMPGRLNETWFKAERTGMYYGECSELCGQGHAFMPIAVQVVTEDQYKAWSEAAKSDLDKAYKTLQAAIDTDEHKVAVASK